MSEQAMMLLAWSETYWFSALRILFAIAFGVAALAILFGFLLRSWPAVLSNPVGAIALLAGPFFGFIAGQIYGLSECQALSVTFGRRIIPITCDHLSVPEDSPFIWTPEEIAEYENSPAGQIGQHWLFELLQVAIFLWVAYHAISTFLKWLKQRREDKNR